MTLVEALEMAVPLSERPVDQKRLALTAGMVTGWFALIVAEANLTDEQRENLWTQILDNLGLEGSPA